MLKKIITTTLMVSALTLTSCAHYGKKGCCCKMKCKDSKQCKMKEKKNCGQCGVKGAPAPEEASK